jgi:hypothetical protein
LSARSADALLFGRPRRKSSKLLLGGPLLPERRYLDLAAQLPQDGALAEAHPELAERHPGLRPLLEIELEGIVVRLAFTEHPARVRSWLCFYTVSLGGLAEGAGGKGWYPAFIGTQLKGALAALAGLLSYFKSPELAPDKRQVHDELAARLGQNSGKPPASA